MPLRDEISQPAKIPVLILRIAGIQMFPLSATVTFSQNNTVAAGTISFATTLAVAVPGAIVSIEAGFNGISQMVFYGYLERPSAGYGPTGGLKATWTVTGWLKRVSYPYVDPDYADAPWPLQGRFQGNHTIVPLGTLITDVELWQKMMLWSGVTTFVPTTPAVSGGLEFGSKYPVIIKGGQSPLDVIKACDQINGFTTIDSYSGTITRIRIDPQPRLANVMWHFREGDPYTTNSGSIYEINRTFDPNGLRNRVIARGLGQLYVIQTQKGQEMLPGVNVLTHDMGSNQLCDDLTKLGFMADVNLTDLNRQTDNVRLTVAGNPIIQVGSWIGITSGKIGFNNETACVVREITHTWDAKSYVSQIMCTPSITTTWDNTITAAAALV